MSIKGNAESNVLRGRISNPDVIHGKSAYEIDVMHGYDGTEEEWLKYVRGDFDERVEEAKAEFNAEVDNVIVPEARAELEEFKEQTVDKAGDEIEQITDTSAEILREAAAAADSKDVLLWTNPSPSEDFASGSVGITVDDIEGVDSLIDFDSFKVIFKTKANQNRLLPSIEVKYSDEGMIHYAEGFTGDDGKAHSRSYSRFFGINAEVGYAWFEGADPDNSNCIPLRIYGVKAVANSASIAAGIAEYQAGLAQGCAVEAEASAVRSEKAATRSEAAAAESVEYAVKSNGSSSEARGYAKRAETAALAAESSAQNAGVFAGTAATKATEANTAKESAEAAAAEAEASKRSAAELATAASRHANEAETAAAEAKSAIDELYFDQIAPPFDEIENSVFLVPPTYDML